VLTTDGRILALDAKFDFDSNAQYSHLKLSRYADLDEEDPDEIEAAKFDLSYIALQATSAAW